MLGTSDGEAIMAVVQENLRQVGIDLQINVLDVAAFVEAANGGDYDLIIVGDSVDVRYPTLMMSFKQAFIDTFTIGGCKWTTPEIEEKIDALIQETDDAKAKEYAGEVEQMYKDEMCFSNTYSELRSALTQSDIKGYCRIERGLFDATTLYRVTND